MGVVIRQGFKSSIFSYLGVIIGYLNLLQLYPLAMSASQIGLLRVILDTALLIMPFAQIGMHQSLVKFFPDFNKDGKGGTLFFNVLLIATASYLCFMLVILASKDHVSGFLSFRQEDYSNYFYLILGLTYLFIIHAIIEAYGRVVLDTVITTFIRDVFFRFFTGVLVALYFFEWVSFEYVLYGLLLIYLSGIVVLLIRYLSNKSFKLKIDTFKVDKPTIVSLVKYGSFTMIGSGGIMLIGKIDALMIASFHGLKYTGIYSIAFFIAMVIEIPKRAVIQTVYPLISESFHNNRMDLIQELYRKTSLNLFLLGALLFIGIVANLDNIYALMPNGEVFSEAKLVIVIIGIGKLIDMIASVNGEIIVLSKYYRYNTFFILGLIVVTILSNLLLIPVFGIEGAALASLLTLLVFNTVKFIFVLKKFKMQPLQSHLLTVIIIAFVSYYCSTFLPNLGGVLSDILIRSAIISSIFISSIYFFKVSADINNIINLIMNKLKIK